jgi:hypothetical protein
LESASGLLFFAFGMPAGDALLMFVKKQPVSK